MTAKKGNIKKDLKSDKTKDITVIVPVVERFDDLEALYSAYSSEIRKLTDDFEFIFIVDGHMGAAYSHIKKFSVNEPHVKVIRFPRTFGEARALSVGFDKARGRYIFILSSYFQVEPSETVKLYNALANDECDIAIARRLRNEDSLFNKIQSLIFHRLLRLLTGTKFKDISCGLKGMKRDILGTFDIYGDLHRFIPVLAEHNGLRVMEIDVVQRREDRKTMVYQARTYLNRVIDLLTLFFLLRFTFRPMRFFGLIGSALIIAGGAINSYLIYYRIFGEGFGLSDKPSLFLASLLIVIGVQIFAIGLIGEIIIYTHSKEVKKFNVKEIID